MKDRLLFVPLILLALSSGPIEAGPITFNTALPVARGEWILRGQYLFVRASDDPSPADRDLKVHAVPIVMAYGVSPRLALFGIVPYLDKRLEMTTPQGRVRREVSGFGDPLVMGRWTAFARDETGSTLRLAPFAGLKLPAGADDASDGLGRLPRPLQLGSGSWDGLGGLTLSWQTLGFELDADAGYRSNGTKESFRSGDEAFADASLQVRVWPREMGAGVPGFVYLVLESNASRQERDRVSGESDPDSGGFRWDGIVGLQYVTARLVLEAAVRLPLVQRLHGNALRTDFSVTAGLRWNFSLF